MRACALLIAVGLATGCGTARPPDLPSPPSPQAPAAGGTDLNVPSARGLPDPGAATVVGPSSVDPPAARTMEGTDSVLAAALADLAGRQSAAANDAVAAAYWRVGVLDQAESFFNHALRLDPHDPEALEGLARVWRDWGLPQRGLSFAYRAVAVAPRVASAQNTLGTVLLLVGDLDGAQGHFERALALAPSAAYARSNLCYLAFLRGEATQALAECSAALALSPALTVAENNLALVYAAGGRADLAAEQFVRADGPAGAAFNLGIVHMARQEYADALVAFRAACRATPAIADACARASEAGRRAVSAGRSGPR